MQRNPRAAMRAIPQSIFHWGFEVREDGRPLCRIDQNFFRERAVFGIAGRQYTLGREPGWGDFWVRDGGVAGPILCRATKASALRRRFEIEFGGERFVLAPRSLLGFAYDLRKGEEIVGSVRKARLFSREMIVDLPAEFPLPVRVFVLWLVLLMRRRASRSD